MHKYHRLIFLLLVSLAIYPSLSAHDAFAEEEKTFKTNYADIVYSDDKTLGDFFWRISGRRFDFETESAPARWRVDGLIERVQSILDMRPENFRVTILLYPEYSAGKIASYSHKRKTIKIFADRVTDGVFAHEVAHAVICNYFNEPPPAKMQEVLSQYVDKYLWSDY